MAFKAYRSTASDHTHENLAFNLLHDVLRSQWAERDAPLHLVGNVFVDGQEIDALILKRNALIVIDFKNYGGNLSFSENGPWRIDGQIVKGGSKANPYQQIRDNKFSFLKYLERQVEFNSEQNLGHIAGLCLFHQDIEFDSQSVPPKIRSWFHVVDMKSAVRTIDAVVSSQITLSDSDLEGILGQLDVPRYFPDGQPEEEVFSYSEKKDFQPDTPLNPEQTKAFVKIKNWLDDTSCKVFSLQGAYNTGKSKVTKKAIEELKARKKTPIFLAPNGRVANRYRTLDEEDINSIYGWLYDKVPNGINKGKQVYPVNRPEVDITKIVIVILESHLLGDDYFDMETTIYGSGHILSDFLNSFVSTVSKKEGAKLENLSSFLPKMLLVGDPYQLKRGFGENSFVSGGIFESRDIDFVVAEIRSQDRDENAPTERLDFQKVLVEQIGDQKFLKLPICSGGSVEAINKGSHTSGIAEKLLHWPKHTAYLCATNGNTQTVNNGIRKNFLAADNLDLLTMGDILDIYNLTIGKVNNSIGFKNNEQIHPGQFAYVRSANPEFEIKSITLKGRDTPVIMSFAKAEIELENGSAFEIEYLPEFLSAIKPELSQDHNIALRIWAKEDADSLLKEEKKILEKLKRENKEKSPEYKEKLQNFKKVHSQKVLESRFTTVARLRYAYAMTVHKSQSYDPFPTIVLDGSSAHDTNNPATDSYFRWLYTATTRSSNFMQILNYPKLSPFSKTIWNFDPKRVGPISLRQQLYYKKTRQPTEAESYLLATNGFSDIHPSLVAILLTVSDLIRKSHWIIESIEHHNYIERYLFTSSNGQVKLDLNYNGKHNVYIGKAAVIDGKPGLESDLIALLHTEPIFESKDIEFAFSLFRDHLAKKQWNIISCIETNFKVVVIAEGDAGRIELDIDMPAAASISKRGIISNVKVKQADSKVVAEQFKANFENE